MHILGSVNLPQLIISLAAKDVSCNDVRLVSD
jgi:hypothetical protein